jgi:hypothetical protein
MIIFIWKLKNYFIAKKANISEFEYWKRKYGQEVKQ